MIITLTFKSPDVLDQLTEPERQAAEAVVKKYIEYGEYLVVQLDTETLEAKVLG